MSPRIRETRSDQVSFEEETKAHTPGPWVYHALIVYHDSGLQGHVCKLSDYFPHDVTRANGNVLAAAPDLLSVVEAIEWSAETDREEGGYEPACPMCGCAQFDGHQDDCPLQAAIKKARGQ